MEPEAPLHHFSHAHPLHLLNVEYAACNACELPCTGPAFSCSPCGYTLHRSCAQAAHTIHHHPAHPPHPLTLHLAPPYPNGSFRCDACGRDGSAFAYHCASCQFDLHIPCTFLPNVLNHPSHQHPLVLTTGLAFSCDLCGGYSEANHWLYLCTPCDYGGHVDCFTSGPRAPPQREQQQEDEAACTPQQQLLLAQLRLQNAQIMADAIVRTGAMLKNLTG